VFRKPNGGGVKGVLSKSKYLSVGGTSYTSPKFSTIAQNQGLALSLLRGNEPEAVERIGAAQHLYLSPEQRFRRRNGTVRQWQPLSGLRSGEYSTEYFRPETV